MKISSFSRKTEPQVQGSLFSFHDSVLAGKRDSDFNKEKAKNMYVGWLNKKLETMNT